MKHKLLQYQVFVVYIGAVLMLNIFFKKFESDLLCVKCIEVMKRNLSSIRNVIGRSQNLTY